MNVITRYATQSIAEGMTVVRLLGRLLDAKEQAENAKVLLRWKGTNQAHFDKLVGALSDASQA